MVCIASIAFVAVLALGLRWNGGVDSFHYISATIEILKGNGFVEPDMFGGYTPFIKWAPGYPLFLAAISLLGFSVEFAAKLFNACLLSGTVILVYGLLRRYLFDRSRLPILGMLLLLTSVVTLRTYSEAMSEPLFVFSTILGIMFLCSYVERLQFTSLFGCSCGFGIAFLSRYIGVVGLFVGIFIILMRHRGNIMKGVFASGFFGAMTFLPMGAWLLRNHLLTAQLTQREMTLHPPNFSFVLNLRDTLLSWLIPLSTPPAVKTLVIILIVVALAVFLLLRLIHPVFGYAKAAALNYYQNPLRSCLWAYLIFYCVIMLISFTFVDSVIYPNERLTYPAMPMLILLVVMEIDYFLKTVPSRRVHRVVLGIIIMFILLQGMRSLGRYIQYRDETQRRVSSESEVMDRLLSIWDHNTPLITNELDPIYYRTGVSVLTIPDKIDLLNPDRQTGRYKDQEKKCFSDLYWQNVTRGLKGSGQLVYVHFRNSLEEDGEAFLCEKEAARRLHVRPLLILNGGTIYVSQP